MRSIFTPTLAVNLTHLPNLIIFRYNWHIPEVFHAEKLKIAINSNTNNFEYCPF